VRGLASAMPGIVVKIPQAHLGTVKPLQPVPTFSQVIMRQGHPVVFHAADKKKVPVHLYILNDCFEWRVLDYGVFQSLMTNKKSATNMVPLKEIDFVVWDKQSSRFIGRVSEDLCFSIVTLDKCLDFECRSKDERDALCQGLSFVIKQAKEQS